MGNWPVPVPNLGPRRKHWLNSLVVVSSSMFKLTPNRAENLLQFAITYYWQKYQDYTSAQVPSMMASFVYTNPDVAVHVRRRWNELSFRKDHRRRSWKSSSCWRQKCDAHWSGMRWSRRPGRRRWTTGSFRSAGRPRWQVDSQIQVFQDESTCLFLFSPKLIPTTLITFVNSTHFNDLKPNRPLRIFHSFKPDSPRCSNCPNWRTNNGEPLISPKSQICRMF